MSKPNARALTKEGVGFVFGNLSVFVQHMKLIFPVLVAFAILGAYGEQHGHKAVLGICFIAQILLSFLFVLSWHRVSLWGTDKEHAINPFNISEWDFRFIGTMLLLSLAPIIPTFIIVMVLTMFTAGDQSSVGSGLIMTLCFVGIIAMIVPLVKLYFVVPARSVGVPLAFKEAWKISKGLVWPIIGAGMLTGIFFVGIGMVYAFVAMILSAPFSSSEIAGYVVMIPLLLLQYLFLATQVTILSRAYRWGAENNPV